MLSGFLHADGRLTDIQARDPSSVPPAGCSLVPVASVPAGFGPLAYDAASQSAVTAPLTFDESLMRFASGRLLGALAIRASASWSTLSAAQKTRVQNVIDADAANIIANLGG